MVVLGIATAVRAKREAAGVSARALSRMAGLSDAYVTKVEAGQMEPSVAAFGKLAVALKMTPHEVFFAVVQEAFRVSPES